MTTFSRPPIWIQKSIYFWSNVSFMSHILIMAFQVMSRLSGERESIFVYTLLLIAFCRSSVSFSHSPPNHLPFCSKIFFENVETGNKTIRKSITSSFISCKVFIPYVNNLQRIFKLILLIEQTLKLSLWTVGHYSLFCEGWISFSDQKHATQLHGVNT